MNYFTTIFLFLILLIDLNSAETIYLSENFQTGKIPATWKNIDNDNVPLHAQNALSTYLKSGEGWTVLSSSGKYWALSTSYFSVEGQADDWMITDQITLGENALLSWDAMSGWATSGYCESYQVMISTGGNDLEDFEELARIDNEGTAINRVVSLDGYSNQNVYLAFRNISPRVTTGYLFIGSIKVFTPEANDVYISTLDIPVFSIIDETGISIKGDIVCSGYQDLNSFEINYQVEDEEIQTATISDLCLKYGEKFCFEHPIAWKPSKAESHNVRVWVSKANGVNDPVASGNEITTKIFAADNAYDKKPLFEEFTSSTCGPCYTANTYYLGPYLDKYKDDFAVIKYQMNWPGSGDPYYNSDGGTRKTYYGVSGVPDLYINGSRFSVSDTNAIRDKSPGLGIVAVKASYYVYEENSYNKINVKVDLTPYFSTKLGEQLVAYVGVVENETYNNARSNGETKFMCVEQKMLPDGNGTTLTGLSNGEVKQLTFDYTFQNSKVENYENLSVVVFVQDRSTKAIFGTGWAALATSVEDQIVDGNGIIGLFPNPAVNNLYIRYNVAGNENTSINILNLEGKEVKNVLNKHISYGDYLEEINISDLASGSYIIKLTIGDRTFSKLFVVNK